MRYQGIPQPPDVNNPSIRPLHIVQSPPRQSHPHPIIPHFTTSLSQSPVCVPRPPPNLLQSSPSNTTLEIPSLTRPFPGELQQCLDAFQPSDILQSPSIPFHRHPDTPSLPLSASSSPPPITLQPPAVGSQISVYPLLHLAASFDPSRPPPLLLPTSSNPSDPQACSLSLHSVSSPSIRLQYAAAPMHVSPTVQGNTFKGDSVAGCQSLPTPPSYVHSSAGNRLRQWLNGNGFLHNASIPKAEKPAGDIVTSVVKKIALTYSLLDSFEASVEHTRSQLDRYAANDWSEHIAQLLEKQKKVQALLAFMFQTNIMTSTRWKLRRRQKKVRQRHRRSIAKKVDREAKSALIAQKHARIDEWRQKMADECNKKAQEKMRKMDHRQKLREWKKTMSKVSERRKMIDLLQQLRQLRKERKKSESNIQDDLRFEEEHKDLDRIIGKIDDDWQASLSGVCELSRCESSIGTAVTFEARKTSFKKALEVVLLERHRDAEADDRERDSSINRDLAIDVESIRKEWDKHIVDPDDDESGSCIPYGYIVPKKSLEDWIKEQAQS